MTKRLLHIACLPFPTFQGTQAAVAEIAEAGAESHETHLLTYAHGAYAYQGRAIVHRAPDRPRYRSLRSGPSATKLAIDAQMVLEARRLHRRLQPDWVIAHHIEAAFVAIAANIERWSYLAHTALGPELPSYTGERFGPWVSRAGSWVERWVIERAPHSFAVSPSLCRRLRTPNTDVNYLSVPWSSAPSITDRERKETRTRLAIEPDRFCILYAGNLDRYQGWEVLFDVLRSHTHWLLCIATESDPAPALRLATKLGLQHRLRIHRLNGEPMRRQAHALANAVVVPRRLEGGLPIKLLDAFARAVPVVTTQKAISGLPVEDHCLVAPSDRPEEIARRLRAIELDTALQSRLKRAGVAYLKYAHSRERCAEILARQFLASNDPFNLPCGDVIPSPQWR